jgi:hypothetical protein
LNLFIIKASKSMKVQAKEEGKEGKRGVKDQGNKE